LKNHKISVFPNYELTQRNLSVNDFINLVKEVPENKYDFEKEKFL